MSTRHLNIVRGGVYIIQVTGYPNIASLNENIFTLKNQNNMKRTSLFF